MNNLALLCMCMIGHAAVMIIHLKHSFSKGVEEDDKCASSITMKLCKHASPLKKKKKEIVMNQLPFN